MAEATGAASGILALLATAYKSCKELHKVLRGMKNTPRHLHTLSKDLEDFYLVLGSIQAIIDDGQSEWGMLDSAASNSLDAVLRSSIEIFSDINTTLKPCTIKGQSMGLSAWKRLKWSFKEKEIERVRMRLLDNKMTLNMAVSVANSYNFGTTGCAVASIQADFIELREKLSTLTQQVDTVRENQLPPARAHADVDRAAIETDFDFTLRHFLDDAAAAITDVLTPVTPSIQISSFKASSGCTTSIFWTAPTQRASDMDFPAIASEYTQLFISNVAGDQTLVFHIESRISIQSLKNEIRQRIKLPKVQFQLTYAGDVLEEASSLDECAIPHNATLRCVSFRPNAAITGVRDQFGIETIVVQDVWDQSHEVDIDETVAAEELVGYVKLRVCDKIGVSPDEVFLDSDRFLQADPVLHCDPFLHTDPFLLIGEVSPTLTCPSPDPTARL
ncbi:hypothetical protein ACLMJK_006286 [Lecanora helva]